MAERGATGSNRPDDAPAERDERAELYDASPESMPPSPAGGNADVGGEAAASRRVAGPRPGEAKPRGTEGPEPFLGYDGLDTQGVLDWLRDAEPDADRLRAVQAYERGNRGREPILRETEDQLGRE